MPGLSTTYWYRAADNDNASFQESCANAQLVMTLQHAGFIVKAEAKAVGSSEVIQMISCAHPWPNEILRFAKKKGTWWPGWVKGSGADNSAPRSLRRVHRSSLVRKRASKAAASSSSYYSCCCCCCYYYYYDDDYGYDFDCDDDDDDDDDDYYYYYYYHHRYYDDYGYDFDYDCDDYDCIFPTAPNCRPSDGQIHRPLSTAAWCYKHGL